MRLHLGPAHDGEHLLAAAHAPSRCAARCEAMGGLSGRHPGRHQHMVLYLGQGRAVHFLNVYGYAGGRSDLDRNADLVLEGLEWLRGLGGAPAFLVGDLNCRLADQGSMGCWEWQGGGICSQQAAQPVCRRTARPPASIICWRTPRR